MRTPPGYHPPRMASLDHEPASCTLGCLAMVASTALVFAAGLLIGHLIGQVVL